MGVMSESPVISQPPAPAVPAGRYRVDPGRSTISFTTRHLFGLAAVHGTLALRDGSVSVADPVTGSAVRASAAASTFASGNPARDAAVLSARLLDAARHPSLTFASTGLTSAAGEWQLAGDLAVRGVSRPVQARITAVSVRENGAVIGVHARFEVDRYAYGITAFRGLAARRLTIDVDILARRDQRGEAA
jgi:polyisoprenoid-binding protein YceI